MPILVVTYRQHSKKSPGIKGTHERDLSVIKVCTYLKLNIVMTDQTELVDLIFSLFSQCYNTNRYTPKYKFIEQKQTMIRS